MTALVVDDDVINRTLLSKILKKSGIDVIEASNGAEAMKYIDKADLVLLDIIMPIMNGIDFIKVIRGDNEYKDLPILVLTTDDSKKEEAMEAGATDFIIKPISPIVLMEKINQITGK
jgi:CheY-like chemotaxis protein